MEVSYIHDIEMIKGFFREALDFLDIPKSKWPDIEEEHKFDKNHKMTPPYVEFDKCALIIHVPYIEYFHPRNMPTAHRGWSYANAWLWYEFLSSGKRSDIMSNPESMVFANALTTLKGVMLGQNPIINLSTISDFITDKLNMRTEVSYGGVPGQAIHMIRFTNEEEDKRSKQLLSLANKSRLNRPPKIKGGVKGSISNPFDNVEDAAEYILGTEKAMLAKDAYRNHIADEHFYYDFEKRYFRIPWASANVAYYDSGDESGDGFVVNQMQSGRFSLKPNLRNRMFLFRGQSSYYKNCQPTLFRPNVKERRLSELIQTYELAALLESHPLVKFLGNGVKLFHDTFEFEMNYLGLSQHYYNCTEYLDLTSDLDVAKFFAVTTFDFDNDR